MPRSKAKDEGWRDWVDRCTQLEFAHAEELARRREAVKAHNRIMHARQGINRDLMYESLQKTRGDISTASPRRVGLPNFDTMPRLPLAAIHAPAKPTMEKFDFSLEGGVPLPGRLSFRKQISVRGPELRSSP